MRANVLLGSAVAFEGRVARADPPAGALQMVILAPPPPVGGGAPGGGFVEINSFLVTELSFDSMSMDVLLQTPVPSVNGGGVASFRNGVDKNFVVRIGKYLLEVLDTVPASSLPY